MLLPILPSCLITNEPSFWNYILVLVCLPVTTRDRCVVAIKENMLSLVLMFKYLNIICLTFHLFKFMLIMKVDHDWYVMRLRLMKWTAKKCCETWNGWDAFFLITSFDCFFWKAFSLKWILVSINCIAISINVLIFVLENKTKIWIKQTKMTIYGFIFLFFLYCMANEDNQIIQGYNTKTANLYEDNRHFPVYSAE